MLLAGEHCMAKNLVVKSEVLNDFHCFLREPLENILGGKIVALRGTYELEKLLASRCGIDAFLVQENKIAGIGIRIHYGQNDRAFTFDRNRETNAQADYEQYLMQRVYGAVTRDFDVEAYIDGDRTCLLGAAAARTEDIYRCMVGIEQANPEKMCNQTENYVVDWDTLRDNGLWIHEFNQNKQEALCQK